MDRCELSWSHHCIALCICMASGGGRNWHQINDLASILDRCTNPTKIKLHETAAKDQRLQRHNALSYAIALCMANVQCSDTCSELHISFLGCVEHIADMLLLLQ